jgi:tRNA A-37 threonylcarbamoyl transferase component Bud32
MLMNLDIENNGGFPEVLSVRMRGDALGEIVMSFVGETIYERFQLKRAIRDFTPFAPVRREKVSVFAINIIQQLEILHSLGLVHGDLRPHNICYDSEA